MHETFLPKICILYLKTAYRIKHHELLKCFKDYNQNHATYMKSLGKGHNTLRLCYDTQGEIRRTDSAKMHSQGIGKE